MENTQTSFVHRLVNHALVQSNVPEKDRQAHSAQLFSYAVRILGSKLSSKTLNDEQAVLQALRLELEQQGKASNAARCTHCAARMSPRAVQQCKLELQHSLRHPAFAAPAWRQHFYLVEHSSAGLNLTGWGVFMMGKQAGRQHLQGWGYGGCATLVLWLRKNMSSNSSGCGGTLSHQDSTLCLPNLFAQCCVAA
eukprot:1159454-Pelagomonas_calceolata.AAC.2